MSNQGNGGIAGARTSQFTIKYKAYGEPSPSPSKPKKRPSEHIKEALEPPLSHRRGAVRPKPSIVEKHNFAERPYQFVSAVPEDEPLFQPFPPEILFTGYEAFQKYSTVLQLRNNDKVVRRVQVSSRHPKLLTVQLSSPQGDEPTVYSEIGSSKVACGMEVAYTVTFYPETDRDCMLELLAVTDREKFIIPVKCVGLKSMLDIPDEIVFPPTPAKCSYKKNVTIHNVGKKKALFSLKAKGAFAVKPPNYQLEPGSFFQCAVFFMPRKTCEYEGELEVTYRDHDEQIFSKLIGVGTELDVGLSTGVAAALTTYIRKTSRVTLQIYNNSPFLAYFLWPKFATKEELAAYKEQVGDCTFEPDVEEYNPVQKDVSEEDVLLSTSIDKAFSITPAKGEVWPGTLLEVAVTFCPPKPLRYMSTTYCIISGKSDPLPLQLQGLGIGPLAKFSPPEIDMGELSLYTVYNFKVVLENLGDLDAHFRLMETLPSFMVTFNFQPDAGMIEPGESQVIQIRVCGNAMGRFNEKFLWEITDSINTLSLIFKGRITMPSFLLSVRELDFGLISYGLHASQEIHLKNNSPVGLSFSFQIQHSTPTPEFSVNPSSFVLASQEIKTVSVDLVPWEVKNYACEIRLDMPPVGTNFACIPVKARCLVPIVAISTDVLNFGTCFLRYAYNSSLTLINQSLVPARFEIQPQEEETKAMTSLKTKVECGLLPPGARLPLEFTLSTESLGEISLAATISISGKEFTHFPVRILANSIGPILKIERAVPPKKGHEEAEWIPAIDFGKVQVLKDHCQTVIVRNTCCIPAPLKIQISKKESVYHLSLSDVHLDPFASVDLQVRAYLDDASRFKDKISIVYEGGELFIPLSAVGIGSTLLCDELTSGIVHFGDQFTLRHFSYSFTLQNMGRQAQTLAWDNETNRKQKAANKMMANEGAEAKKGAKKASIFVGSEIVSVFNMNPEKATIKPYSPLPFTISGYSTEPGHVQEDFVCKVTSAKNMSYVRLSVDAEMAALTLIFSATSLKFVQNNGWGEDGPHELKQTLKCENVSKLPLSFSLNVKPPFHINQADWTLVPAASGLVEVTVEKQDIKEKISTMIHGKLDIMYTGTLERANIDLLAEINYPNISLDAQTVNFGCVVESTSKRMLCNLKNTSALDVWYSWVLDDSGGESIHASADTLAKTGGLKIPTNQIFDILPIQGYLHPGEEEVLEISYFAHLGYDCRAIALCEVKGGPIYSIRLQAESGVIRHSLTRTSLDFSVQSFNKTSTKDFSLINIGKVPFGYHVDLSCLKGTSLTVSPMNGELEPSVRQKFTAFVYPGLPEKFSDNFKIQVAFFPPTEISICGIGQYPHILLDFTRIRSHQFLSLAAEAFQNVFTALREGSALYSHRSMDTLRSSLFNDKPKDSARSEAAKEHDAQSVQQESEHVESVAETETELDIAHMPMNTVPSHSDSQTMPTIDQVDAEVDRLLFKEFLINAEKENEAANVTNKKSIDFQKFILSKYVCDFDNVILGETKVRTLRITNDGPLEVMFKITMGNVKGKGFTLDLDRLITLPPFSTKSSFDLNVKFKTDAPKFPVGLIECSAPLNIKEGPQISIVFKANVTKPVMELSADHLDFGSVQLGHCKVMYFRLSNTGQVRCDWIAAKPELMGNVDPHDSIAFICTPDAGFILPNKYVDVQVQFIPTHKKKAYAALFLVDLMHNPLELKVSCKGHSYVPAFTIEPPLIELGPILPNAPAAAEYKFFIRNNADEPVEIYSLAFDPQYVKEEEILRNVDDYDEKSHMFLERRDAGKPFWPHLLSKETAETVETTPTPSPREKEKVTAVKGGKAPTPAPPPPEPSPHANKLLILMLGPPAIGKTTQAKMLSLKFNCPVIDMEEAIVCVASQSSSSTVDGSNSQTSASSSDLTDFEKDLIVFLKERLLNIDCCFGAIFDGFNTTFATPVSLVKCVLYAIGMQPYDPNNPDDGKKKGGADKKKPPAKDTKSKGKPEAKPDEAEPVVFPKAYWQGEPTVYAVALKADQTQLDYRYSEIPEIDHCKKKSYLDLGSKETLQQRPLEDSSVGEFHLPESSEVPDYRKYYPYVSALPTPEDVEKYYSGVENINNLLGGVLTAEEAAALGHKIVVIKVDGLLDTDVVYEDELKSLPNLDNVAPVPSAKVLQVVKKPHVRTSFLNDTSGLKFSILTAATPPPADDAKKVKPADKSAAAKKGGKPPEIQGNPLQVIPEGYAKQTRWIIPPQETLEQTLQFWSTAVGDFEQKFVYEGLNGHTQARLMCKGVCAEPQIRCHYKHVKIPNVKLSVAAKLQKALFVSEGTLDFGPLPTGRTADGFPEIPDSEHCKRLEIINIGLFDLHVDFDVNQGETTAAVGKKPAKDQGKKLFLVHPPSMDLKISEKQFLNIYSYPPQGQLGPVEGKLACIIKDNPVPMEFKVICLADTPRVELDSISITFERLLLNHEDKKVITIRNISALVVHWKIAGLEGGPAELTFSETSGTLNPLTTATVDLLFKAVQEKMFNQKLKLQVFESKDAVKVSQELPLSITGEAYKIEIAIKYPSPPEEIPPDGGFNYGTIRVAQDSMKSLTMDNKGKYKVGFKFCFKTKLMEDLFTITPIEGTMDPKKQQKVDIHFNKDKKLQKEVNLRKSRDIELHLIECLTGKTEQLVTVFVNVHAVHSKYILLPAQGIHFGSQICGTSPPPRILRLVNTGEFDFTYRLLTLTEVIPEPSKAADKSKKPDKKAGSAEALELQSFRVIPSGGSILPGNQQDISVYFKADIPCLTSENFKIDISDTDPYKFPGGMMYELSGESCLPGIRTDPATIFYGYRIVEEIDLLGRIPEFGTYSKNDEIFSFGPVIINYELAANAVNATDKSAVSSGKEAAGASVKARLKFENPLRVPCSLQFVLRRKDTAAGSEKGKAGGKGVSEEPLCMDVFPEMVDLPPLEYRFITCTFKPLSLQKFTAVFEVISRLKGDVLFQCEFRGEGTLPHLDTESPSTVTELGFPWVKFPRLLVGKTLSLPIILQNNGLVPAAAKLETASGATTVDWFQIDGNSSPLDYPTKMNFPVDSTETLMVTFTPVAAGKFKEELYVTVTQNPFDIIKISISGESYTEEVLCIGLPRELDDAIWFDDCGIGAVVPISFTLKNTALDKHWRFAWSEIPFLHFSPALGHLHGGASKEILLTFNPTEAVEYVDKDLQLQLCNIVLPEESLSVDWDDRMLPPPEPQNDDPKAKAKVAPPAKAKGKPGDKGAAPQLTIEGDLRPGEPGEIMQGTGKAIALKLHAIADNARYECSIGSVQFKSTFMFQVRTFCFTLKNLSKSKMPFFWQVEKEDGAIDKASMYVLDPPAGLIQSGETMELTLRFCPSEVVDCTRFLVAEIPNLDPSMTLRIPAVGTVMRPWCHFELPRSDYTLRRDPEFTGPNGEVGSLDPAVHIIEFDSLGSNIRNVKYFTAMNPTNIPYKFVWEAKKSQSLKWTEYDVDPIDEDEGLPEPFKCLTRTGEIRGGKRYEMAFEYTPNRLRLHECFWSFRIPDRKIEVNFLMVGNVKKPELSLDHSIVDFGQVLVGAKTKHVITLTNPELSGFGYFFDKLSYSPSQPGQIALLKFTPSSGIVAAGSYVTVELLFSPVVEGHHSFDIVCNLKKAAPLSLSVKAEAYTFHEKIYLEGADDGRPLELIPKQPLRMDYGEVIINSRLYKKFILTNHGIAGFSFMWDCGDKKDLVRVEPLAGVVERDEQVTCDLLFHPTAETTFDDYLVVCQIMQGNKYPIHITGLCYRPKIRFSFTEFDFGQCFLHQRNRIPSSTVLTISNEGHRVYSCELLYDNTSFLEIEPVCLHLSPGQTHTTMVIFKPEDFVVYKEVVRFQIAGLDIVLVNIRGEGVPVLLELVDPKQRYLSLGAVRLGTSVRRYVQIINKSKIAADISFEPSQEIFRKLGITCLPKEGLTLQPVGQALQSKYMGTIELVYNPSTRMTQFTEGLVVEVAGTKARILTVSGICLAVEVKLNTNVMPFDIVTLGSKMTRKIQLENRGDLATNFAWDLSKCKSFFSIFPQEGFLAPRQVARLDITFHPPQVDPDIRIEGISCQLQGGDPLSLTLIGGCIEQGPSAEILKFNAAVRTSEMKTIQLSISTAMDRLLHPLISHEYWSGPISIEVPAKETVGYSLTYKPMSMSKNTEPHQGTISFPLPDGTLLSYQLTGEAGPPLADGNIRQDVKARVRIPISLQVQNWLKTPQQFAVIVEMKTGDASSTVLKGPKVIDIPSLSKKECVLYFRTQKPGTTTGSAIFKSKQSGEYSFFDLTIDASKADIVDRVNFDCFIRQQDVQRINLDNPSQEPVKFQVKCQDLAVIVPATVEVPAKSHVPVAIIFRPLVAGSSSSMLIFQNEKLGEYEYELNLRAVPAPPETPLLFSVSLGSQLKQPFKFKHFLPVKSAYTCTLSSGAAEIGFSIDQTVVQANPATGFDGVDLEVQVSFEPTRVIEDVEAVMSLKCPEGSNYECVLMGSCSSPSPQGPIFIKGSGQIDFKNVYNESVQFNYITDNPAFGVSKGEKMPPKKQSKLVITYKPTSPHTSKTGRLTVTCDETSDVWLFYLQAI